MSDIEVEEIAFFDRQCPKGGTHQPEVIGDSFTFKCSKCGEKE